MNDLTNQKFGLLKALYYLPPEKNKRGKWLCQCDCGKQKAISTNALTSGATKSCGCNSYASEKFRKDISGQRFGRLYVISYHHSNEKRQTFYECQCDCGNIKVINRQSLIRGATQSCGCFHKERTTKHKMSKHRIYSIWHHMKERCYNPNHVHYSNYGDKNIKICDQWINDFNEFLNWCLNNGYDESLTLDRINSNGDYEPNNCKFSTSMEQANNRTDNVFVELENKKLTVAQWSRLLNIHESTIRNRIKRGLAPHEILSPVK